MSYIKHHWQGKLPLALSFWVNTIGVGLIVYSVSFWMRKSPRFEDPVFAARVHVLFFLLVVLILLPWQMVGLWRASRLYTKQFTDRVWGGVTRFVVMLVILRVLGFTFFPSPVMESRFKTGFGKDEFANYEVSLTNNGRFLRVQGSLGFGVSKKVKRLIENNTKITGVILESGGGWLYEGRQLARLILDQHLDTYTIKRCSSACVLAFAAGERRYLVQGGRLGFHQYQTQNKKLDPFFNQKHAQDVDRNYYLDRGIQLAFVEQIFKAGPNDIWYPSWQELIRASMVHEVLRQFDT